MHKIIVVLSIVISFEALAFTCRETGNSYDPAVHWPLATDVVLGSVTEGRVVNDTSKSADQMYQILVHETLKGELHGKVEILNDSNLGLAGLVIGQSYIIFLYDGNELDFCSLVIEVLPGVKSLHDLRQLSEREDIGYAKHIASILELARREP